MNHLIWFPQTTFETVSGKVQSAFSTDTVWCEGQSAKREAFLSFLFKGFTGFLLERAQAGC